MTQSYFTREEQAQLRRLVYQAFDLRETPYFTDAVYAIVEWNERLLPDLIERAERRGRS
jgi:hypothetical protein